MLIPNWYYLFNSINHLSSPEVIRRGLGEIICACFLNDTVSLRRIDEAQSIEHTQIFFTGAGLYLIDSNRSFKITRYEMSRLSLGSVYFEIHKSRPFSIFNHSIFGKYLAPRKRLLVWSKNKVALLDLTNATWTWSGYKKGHLNSTQSDSKHRHNNNDEEKSERDYEVNMKISVLIVYLLTVLLVLEFVRSSERTKTVLRRLVKRSKKAKSSACTVRFRHKCQVNTDTLLCI